MLFPRKAPTKQHVKDLLMALEIIESYIRSGHIKPEDPEHEVYQDIKRRNK